MRWSNDAAGVIHDVSDGLLELGGGWANYGTITADGNVVEAGTGSLSNFTRIVLGDDLNSSPYDVNSDNGAFVDNGTITSDAWVNYGTITTNNANVYLGGWLSMDPGAHNVATLDLSQNVVFLNGTLDDSPADNPDTGGVLDLAPGVTSSTGTWNLNGGRIYEGTITTSGGAVLNAVGFTSPFDDANGNMSGVLDGVTLDGTLNMSVLSASQYQFYGLTIVNNLTLNTTLELDGTSLNARCTLYFVHPAKSGPFGQTLSGSGTIVFGSGGAIDVASSDYDSSTSVEEGYYPAISPLTIGSGITIVGPGSGVTCAINGPIDNQGTIEETAGGALGHRLRRV